MATEQPWFVGQRAEALATIYLTRYPSLEVVPVGRHDRSQGYDLLVEIKGVASPEPIIFAVEAKGVRTISTKSLQAAQPVFALNYSHNELRGSVFPICVFLFATDDEQGFYRWLHKPLVTGDGRATLELDDAIPRNSAELRAPIKVKSAFQRLDDDAITMLVQQVTRWYDAKHAAEAAAD